MPAAARKRLGLFARFSAKCLWKAFTLSNEIVANVVTVLIYACFLLLGLSLLEPRKLPELLAYFESAEVRTTLAIIVSILCVSRALWEAFTKYDAVVMALGKIKSVSPLGLSIVRPKKIVNNHTILNKHTMECLIEIHNPNVITINGLELRVVGIEPAMWLRSTSKKTDDINLQSEKILKESDTVITGGDRRLVSLFEIEYLGSQAFEIKVGKYPLLVDERKEYEISIAVVGVGVLPSRETFSFRFYSALDMPVFQARNTKATPSML
ncbi:MAG: hypothetical protein MN733_19235 [Nitrososphaera sp.]|nr:hypothetical protein [Nitrososphaera sp.]